MILAQSSLTMVGLNTTTPQVFWKGQLVTGITSIRVDWENDEQNVTLRVNTSNPELYAEMSAAGIKIRGLK
jgi:hypothetical protein